MGVREAKKEDSDAIHKIAKQNSLSEKEHSYSRKEINEFKKDGFLVSDYSLNDYEKFIEQRSIHVFVDGDGIVKAFILIFKKDQLDKDEPVYRLLIQRSGKDDFIVIKQICVERESMKKQYAAKLYIHLMSNYNNYDFYTAIVTEPKCFNMRSVKFHEDFGFVRYFNFKPDDLGDPDDPDDKDGKERTLFYFRSLNNCSAELLAEQYKTAVDLYIHEDNLVWQKINFFLIISSALFALDGWLPKALTNPITSILLSTFGIIVSVLFYMAISNGLEYMLARKNAVMEIEMKLISLGGTCIVSPGYMSRQGNVNLLKSSTMRTIRLLISLIGIIWLVIIGYTIYNF